MKVTQLYAGRVFSAPYLRNRRERLIRQVAAISAAALLLLAGAGLYGGVVTETATGAVIRWRCFSSTEELVAYARAHMPRQLTAEERTRFLLE